MSKQIRPLVKFKKEHLATYKALIENAPVSSKKGEENCFYYKFSNMVLCREIYEEPIIFPNFFWANENKENNKKVNVEAGKFLVSGIYYNIEEWTKKVSINIFKTQIGIKTNDELKSLFQHIRENIGYYYYNENELNLIINK